MDMQRPKTPRPIFDPAKETLEEFKFRYRSWFYAHDDEYALQEFSPYKGPLMEERLPSDAWEKWCKDDVVCFGMNAYDVLKIYFGNPRDLSVYFVADFCFREFFLAGDRNIDMVGYALVGSKIHIVGGDRGGFLWCYYCDVAENKRDADGCFEFLPGGELLCRKPRPCVFSLSGGLYVLSMHFAACPFSFEALEPGESRWRVLSPPFLPGSHDHIVLGSLVIEDDKNNKFLVYSSRWANDHNLSIFDSESTREHGCWTRLKLGSGPESGPKLSSKLCSIFSIEDLGLLLGRSKSFVIATFSVDFELDVLGMFLGLDTMDKMLGKRKEGKIDEQWHLLPLNSSNTGKGKLSVCLVALYADHDEKKSYVRLSTFDLVQRQRSRSCYVSDAEGKRRRHKLDGYGFEVGNQISSNIQLVRGISPLLPCGGCPEVRSRVERASRSEIQLLKWKY